MLCKLTDKPQGYVILCVPQCWSYKCVPAHPVSSSREQTQVLMLMWQVLYWLIDTQAPALEAPAFKGKSGKEKDTVGEHRGACGCERCFWEWCEGSRHHREANGTKFARKEQVRKRTFKGRSRQEPRVTRNVLSQQGRGNWAANSTSVACDNESSEMDSKL